MRKTTPEGAVMQAVAKYLTLKKHFWIRINTTGVFDTKMGAYRPSPYTVPGTPDILVVWNLQAVFIELKAPKGKLSAPQILFREWCKEYGIEYHVVRSVDDLVTIGL
jgi:hypothetical protein